MSRNLENLKEQAWTALAAVKLCKTLMVAFLDWKMQASSSLPIDLDTVAKLVHEILECEDQAECKKAIPQVVFDLRTAHKYWSDCVHELWEPLRPKLDTLSESRCKHEAGKVCTSCKIQRRIIINSFLWADFMMDPTAGNTEYLKVTEMVLDNTLMIMAARCEHDEGGGTSYWYAVSNGEEDLLVHLQKLPGNSELHPDVAYWRELLLNLIEYSPVVRTRVKSRHAYEPAFEPGVATVDA